MEKEVSVAMPMTVIFSVLAAAGIVLAVICLAFNCIFRNRKLVVHCICNASTFPVNLFRGGRENQPCSFNVMATKIAKI